MANNMLILLNERRADIVQMVCYVHVQDSNAKKYMALSD